MQVVADTNIIVSAIFFKGKPRKFLQEWFSNKFEVVCSEEIYNEYIATIEKIAEKQTEEDIKNGLTQLLNKLGGIGRFVKKGQTVVIKPNLVSEHGIKNGVIKGGIVTDIRVVKELVELLLPVAGKIIIAEG